MAQCAILNSADTVAVALEALPEGTAIEANGKTITLRENVPYGHKIATVPMAENAMVVKYGMPIGHATASIAVGDWVHVHNMATNLSGEEEYRYMPSTAGAPRSPAMFPDASFMGYGRKNGTVGIRNEVWLIPTVGCSGWLTDRLARQLNLARPDAVDEVVTFPHPCGCPGPGPGLDNVRSLLSHIATHPNAGAILFIGLGCEHNTMAEFRAMVEALPSRCEHIAYMVAQEVQDEMAEGLRLAEELILKAATAKRESFPASTLCIGMKCGASDGLSGVTANPLLGAFADWLVDVGGSVMLTEVPEMFGAERLLLARAADENVFENGVEMINQYKRYFIRYGREIYENPSPGNREGGISTLEDKSGGCVQKVGTRTVTGVLPYSGCAGRQPGAGVNLLYGPGEDMVAVSNLAAAGAHLVLFSTGSGNPLGAPVPVVKVASNSALAANKPHWIDFDAGRLAQGEAMEQVLPDFIRIVLRAASGERTRNEAFGYRELVVFDEGVTL